MESEREGGSERERERGRGREKVKCYLNHIFLSKIDDKMLVCSLTLHLPNTLTQISSYYIHSVCVYC